MGLLVLATGVRGTWTEVLRDPASAAEDPVCQVVRGPGGAREVRSAVRLPYPLEEVWSVLTDYDNFGDICECLKADQIIHQPDGSCLLKAQARSGLPGYIPFEAHVRHERRLDEYVSRWDQPSEGVPVNRGRWVLTPLGPRETLAALSLEVEVDGIPAFVLRNLSLGRLPDVLRGLERRLRTGGPGKKW
jgi:hypothetical protein